MSQEQTEGSFQQNNLLDENEYLHMKNEMLEKQLHEYIDYLYKYDMLFAILRDIIINFSTEK